MAPLAILLDGKPVKTPAKNALALPTLAAAQAVAAEWQAQGEYIEPETMPLTRLVHSALDGVAGEKIAWTDEIVKYAGSDLVCYRAGEPESLAKAQAEAWDPFLAFAHETFGAQFICSRHPSFCSAAGTGPAGRAWRSSAPAAAPKGNRRARACRAQV